MEWVLTDESEGNQDKRCLRKFGRAQVIGVFSIDAEVIAIGQTILVAQLCSTIFAGLSALFTSIFQAFGKEVQSSVMSVVRGSAFILI